MPPGLILLMIIGLAAGPIAFINGEVPLAVGTLALERATAPPPGLVTLTPGLSVTVNKGVPVVGPLKVMLVLLKGPMHIVLGEAAVSVPGLDTGVQVCASAGSDKPSDKGTRQEAARSSNFRRFAVTSDSRRQFPTVRPLFACQRPACLPPNALLSSPGDNADYIRVRRVASVSGAGNCRF